MLRQQESGHYAVPRNFLDDDMSDGGDKHGSTTRITSATTSSAPVDAEFRSKMVVWCYHVVDYCEFRRESVEIAFNYLDRYLTTQDGGRHRPGSARNDRITYQLATIVALYLAIKIHEPEAMDLVLVSVVCRGAFTPGQVKDMEVRMLAALEWRLNPPTSLSFVRSLLSLIPTPLLRNNRVRKAAYEATKYRTELALIEYDFVGVRSSEVALRAILTSLRRGGIVRDLKVRNRIKSILFGALGIEPRERVTKKSGLPGNKAAGTGQPHTTGAPATLSSPPPAKITRRSSFHGSPRSVGGPLW